jgi:hypothetical protein
MMEIIKGNQIGNGLRIKSGSTSIFVELINVTLVESKDLAQQTNQPNTYSINYQLTTGAKHCAPKSRTVRDLDMVFCGQP